VLISGRILRNTLLENTSGKIKDLSNGLLNLRANFDTGIAIHTATISFRFQQGMSVLGKVIVPLR
jgi:hypothetical protein